MSIRGSSNVVINDSNFTNVEGNQYIYQYLYSPQSEERTIWDYYKRIIPGETYLKRFIAEAPIEQNEHESTKLQARRIFSIAEIIGVGGRDFLHVGYSGEHAFELFPFPTLP
ncbi:hypothetical protein MPER_11440 [Moniliophthora perniciosa FA553]|nr:hypothetical protein MPER_11440 [Moniliophthora perniciosa FA553]